MNPEGQTLHGDHARVTFQIPVEPARCRCCSGTAGGRTAAAGTPRLTAARDSRPFSCAGASRCIARSAAPRFRRQDDDGCRGPTGRTSNGSSISSASGSGPTFTTAAVLADPAALEQFFRAMVPDTGPIDAEVIVSAASAALDRIGPAILVTHSHAGGFGWLTADPQPQRPGRRQLRTRQRVRLPRRRAARPRCRVPTERSKPLQFPLEEFAGANPSADRRLLRRQHPDRADRIAGRDNWRVRLAMARLWVEPINRHGGDADVRSLPEMGIHGNTHFAFSDLNNHEIADQIAAFLAEKSLD